MPNSRMLHWSGWRWLPLITGFALRLWVAWQPISMLVLKNLPDDAFYYFMVARHAAQSASISLDGLHVTNGFHPLWAMLVLPIMAWPIPLGDVQVHLVLTLACGLELITIDVIRRIGTDLTNREEFGILAAWMYALNPVVILQSTNGLETALSIALLVVFWRQTMRWLTQPYLLRSAIVCGGLGGLMFLARSDTLFFFVLMMGAILWHRSLRAEWKRVAWAGATAAGVVAPWLMWSNLTLGSWVQDSALAVPLAAQGRFAQAHGDSVGAMALESLRQLFNPTLWLRGDPTGLPLFVGLGLWAAVGFGLTLRWRKHPNRLEQAVLWPLMGAGATLIISHTVFRWYPRPWYFIPLAAAWAMGAAVALAPATPVSATGSALLMRRRVFWAALGVSVYFAVAGLAFWQVGLYPWQKDMWAASTWISENVPVGSRVGSFNAGLYAYYSGRTVVNLDGVINHTAYEAILDHALLPYMRRAGVEFLVDYDWAIRHEYAPFMGQGFPAELSEVMILGGRPDEPLGALRVYQLTEAP